MRRRRRRDTLVFLAAAVLTLAGCGGSRESADVGPYRSGRYRPAALVTTRPAATAPTTVARSYRLPTTNLAPAYDYDTGEPRRQAYVDIGPYNPGYPVAPDYDTANRTLYDYHESQYGYPNYDGFYGAPTRPRFYGNYYDWYYGPRYRHRSPWHRFDTFGHDRFGRSRLDHQFDRFPRPYRNDRDEDDDRHDARRAGGGDARDRGERYERGGRDLNVNRRPASRAPEVQRSDERRRETTRPPEPRSSGMGRVNRPAAPVRSDGKYRASSSSNGDGDSRGGGSNSGGASRTGRGQSRSR